MKNKELIDNVVDLEAVKLKYEEILTKSAHQSFGHSPQRRNNPLLISDIMPRTFTN